MVLCACGNGVLINILLNFFCLELPWSFLDPGMREWGIFFTNCLKLKHNLSKIGKKWKSLCNNVFFYFAYKLVSARRGKGWGYFNGAGGNTKQKVILCWLKMGIRMHLQAQEIKERVLTALIPDSCCDRCMTILMTRGMRSDFFFSRCKIPIYFKSKSVKKKRREKLAIDF